MSKSGRSNRRGCLPWILGAVLLLVWFGGDEDEWGDAPLSVEQFDPRSPRRPMPDIGESFVIAIPARNRTARVPPLRSIATAPG